jgi:hypothetical protein
MNGGKRERILPTARVCGGLKHGEERSWPFDTFQRADDLIRAVSRLGPIVKEIHPRKIFSNGQNVCIVYDMVMSTQVGTVLIAEVFDVGVSGKITSIQAFFEAFGSVVRARVSGT